MKNILSNIWFPLALVSSVAVSQGIDFRGSDDLSAPGGFSFATPDTVTYPSDGYKRGWSDEERGLTVSIADSLLNVVGEGFGEEFPEDGNIADSAAVRISEEESYLSEIDTTVIQTLDSLWREDSLFVEKNIFDHWYAGLDPKQRKAYDKEMMIPILRAQKDSIREAKEFNKAYKDSVKTATPRILNTYFLPDTLQYQRLVTWTHDRNFHDITITDSNKLEDFNYRFNDYPFLRNDVNATWLGVAGSPVLYNDYFKRRTEEGAMFYDTMTPWSYSPQTLPMFNTKTPYTELSYSGTLFTSEQTASHNLHLLTTQNITPNLNLTLMYERFGGEGPMSNEETANRNSYIYLNYVGEKYLMHAGYISNYVFREENGGVLDLAEVRDTTMDAREIKVYLTDASSSITKKTFFLDQQYRIPMTFLLDMFKKKDLEEVPDEEEQMPEDSVTVAPVDVTTAFIGHSSEFTRIGRLYEDKIKSTTASSYYGDRFYNNPGSSRDSLGVTKFDNKLFIRLQPWAKEALVSKLDVGIGENIMQYAKLDPTYLHVPEPAVWTSTYAYAGAQGGLGDYFNWNALGHYSLLGDEAGDFDLSGDAQLRFYPFRRARTSPLSLSFHAETSLDEPQYYVQHMRANHFKWENDFDKISVTKASGRISIPHWKLDLSVNYALLVNNIYYDASGIIRQNGEAMSIFSSALEKDLSLLGFLHLDNRVLFQLSSNQDVVPLPKLSANGRYYAQFSISKGALIAQLGANAFYYTKYNLQRWNPNVGVFYNQKEREYGNAPYIDLFANLKWQDVCVFVKWENAGMGWPLSYSDYFSSDGNIRTPRIFKVGVFWPFHPKPGRGVIDPGPGGSPSGVSTGGSSSSSNKTSRVGGAGSSGGLRGAKLQSNR